MGQEQLEKVRQREMDRGKNYRNVNLGRSVVFTNPLEVGNNR